MVLSQVQRTHVAASYWVVPGKLLAGAYPGAYDQKEEEQKLGSLLDLGVTRFVNLMEVAEHSPGGTLIRLYEGTLLRLAQGRGIRVEHSRHPIKDVSVTSIERMVSILDHIDSAIAVGQVAYVHCLGGRGRTGTVIGCWLVRHGLALAQGAVAEIARLRAGTPDSNILSPDTGEQRRMIEA